MLGKDLPYLRSRREAVLPTCPGREEEQEEKAGASTHRNRWTREGVWAYSKNRATGSCMSILGSHWEYLL